MPNPIRYMYFIIKHQINIQLLSVLFHDITVVLYIVIPMKAGLFFCEFCLLHFFSGIYIEYHYDKRWMLQTIYKCWKKMVTKHPSQLVQKTVSWKYTMNRLLIQQTTECLQNVYRGMLSSPQIRLKHFQRMMFPPIHQLRHTLCLFYQNMIQRIDGQKADLYITLTLCNKDFI